MKLLLSCLVALSTIGSAFADQLIGMKIIDTGDIPLEGLSHWVWPNSTGVYLEIKRIQMFTAGGNGASWVLQRSNNNVVMITTAPQGQVMDFGSDYMLLPPGDYLDVYFQAQHGDVLIWVTPTQAPPNPSFQKQ